jgi:hypothetical protein
MEERKPGFSYLFLLRIPLIIFLIVVSFRPLAFHSGLGAYLVGMYDTNYAATVATCASAVLLWLALTTTAQTVLRTAYLRFMLEEPPAILRKSTLRSLPFLNWIGVTDVWVGVAAASGLAAVGVLWMLSGFYVVQGAAAIPAMLAGIGLGLLTLATAGWFVTKVGRTLRSGQPGYLALLMRRIGTPEGYFHQGEPVAGHKFAFNAMLISLALYGWVGIQGWRNDMRMPTLLCVILLLTNACWLLAGLTYFLDRWRIPVFFVLIVYGTMSSYWSADHVFPVVECRACQPTATAAQVLGAGPAPVVLVATSGGGILAAAWTNTVLGELSRQPDFVPALKLISSVSGGSNGAMHFLHHLRQKTLTPDRVFEDAARSSLDAVAWGLTYPDFLRTLPTAVVFEPKIDRAHALRSAWTSHDQRLRDATLAQWSAGPNMPAVMFNATVAETGDRFVFANYAPARPTQPVPARRVFFEAFEGYDVPVSAAVANSAAFPYVSPAARADLKPGKRRPLFHLVDGGYTDNFGVASALGFLKDAVAENPENAKRSILLLMIEASPDCDNCSPEFQSEGWFYQAKAPPIGLINMWQIAARSRNFAELEWVKKNLPQLRTVRFVYRDPQEYPTSWHLTKEQQGRIRGYWQAKDTVKARACVEAFLRDGSCPP